ncbi:MAG TPA: MBL fold metallo-hydrolase [Candidatus Acidoferrales bacterium]|nr:MBL fold metallo-hydrolase [Candidatus Acidoferrales bacterium]
MRNPSIWRAAGAWLATAAVCCAFVAGHRAWPQEAKPAAANSGHGVFVVFLGTGMPRPDPERQGPSLAIVANGKAYIVDAGVGVVRQAAAAYARGISALKADQLDIAFLTHLHSDHTLGLPDLILTPWVMHRTAPLRLYGPMGTQAMADNIEKAWAEDIDIRVHGLEHNTTTGYKVVAHEIHPGVVYQDANVKVTPFAVLHGNWKEALGYRFDADGKSIVISGDTRPAQSVVDACSGCDILIHEVYSGEYGNAPNRAYFSSFHTSAEDLGEIAAKARPKLLVIIHYVPLGKSDQTEMLTGICKKFHGPVIVANDLDVISP